MVSYFTASSLGLLMVNPHARRVSPLSTRMPSGFTYDADTSLWKLSASARTISRAMSSACSSGTYCSMSFELHCQVQQSAMSCSRCISASDTVMPKCRSSRVRMSAKHGDSTRWLVCVMMVYPRRMRATAIFRYTVSCHCALLEKRKPSDSCASSMQRS